MTILVVTAALLGSALAGAVFYLVGTVLVTRFGNVPWNDRLVELSAAGPAPTETWERYVGRWTTWNHVRTAAAFAAALSFSIGLLRHAGA